MIEFTSVMEEGPRGGALVPVPSEVVAELGGGGRIPVMAAFDGVEYRGSIVTMGGRQILAMLRSIREKLGKGPGDQVVVGVRRDQVVRTVEVPPELERAFAHSPEAREALDTLSYSHQREHVNHIIEAKTPETRERRARSTVKRLLEH